MKIKVVVLVQSNGKWNCAGWVGATDEEMKESVIQFLDPCDQEVIHFVEVDVPLPPQPQTFQGKVAGSSEILEG